MPTIRIIKRFMVASGIAMAVLAALAPGAWAELEVSGTYDGKIVCKGFGDNGQPVALTFFDSDLKITRGLSDLRVATGNDSRLSGRMFDDADHLKRAEASLISCGTEAEPFPVGLIAHLKFTLSGTTLKFTAKSVVANSENVLDCTWTFKRTNAADPGVGNCSDPV